MPLEDPTYIMLFLGFFSCGFQLAFITAHFPAFIAEASSPIIQGSLISISLQFSCVIRCAINSFNRTLFNISWLNNSWGNGENIILKNIYYRLFILVELLLLLHLLCYLLHQLQWLVFSIVMGSLWLATVPLNFRHNSIHIYGLKIYGNFIWDSFFISSNRFFCRCLVRWFIL